MSTLVSVIVPVYNMEQSLAETLDSILASDYPFIEIILINDGSSDNSLKIANEYAEKHQSIHVLSQTNKGVCAARNFAISHSKGRYILPVDSDNRISPEFIRLAVLEFEKDPEVKVVYPQAMFFGDKTGEWILPDFSLKLIARKNMIDTCAMYPKEEWEKVGGYSEEIIAREDWEFWISTLKNGGKVVKINHVGLFYRVRSGSKRITDRKLKKHVINILNKKHADFFQRELKGPLRYHRTWSKLINTLPLFITKSLSKFIDL